MTVERIGDFLWKTLPNGNAKRQAYYCSHDWGLKKNAVKERSLGICERCKRNRAENVHHKTYERLYQERLDDLWHLCRGCHEYVHGNSNYDPKPRRKLYLAGKIGPHDWREGIVKSLCSTRWKDSPLVAAVRIGDELFDYVGPYFIPNTCKHCSPHGPSTHGSVIAFDGMRGDACCGRMADAGVNCKAHDDPTSEARERIHSLCLNAIRDCDVVFAWLNRKDCHGTLVEIGYAHAMEKAIWIGMPHSNVAEECWFAVKTAAILSQATTPQLSLANCYEQQLGCVHA